MSSKIMSQQEVNDFVDKIIHDLSGKSMIDGIRIIGCMAFITLSELPDNKNRLKYGKAILDCIQMAVECSLDDEQKEEKVYV